MTEVQEAARRRVSDRAVRRALLAVALVQAVVGILFALQVPWATALFPFPGRTPLSNAFVGSIFLAGAASTLWCLLTRADRGFAGVAIDYITIFVPVTVIALASAFGGGGLGQGLFGMATVAGIVVGAMLLRWALTHPWRDTRPTPRPVRIAFAIFVVALIVASSLLILQVPRVLPWYVTPQLSTLYGLMFLGAAAYFVFGIAVPVWENAGGQLAGFLAYDIVLVWPLLAELFTGGGGGYSDDAPGEALPLNLAIYAVVVIGSGLLAAWYLLIRPETAIWRTVASRARGAPDISS